MGANQAVAIDPRRSVCTSVLLLFALMLFAGGCGQSVKPPQCHVVGKILVGGEPAADLCLRFHAVGDQEKMMLPEATWTEADGSFTLPIQTPGEYLVTALWPTVEIVEGERIEGADRFAGRLNNLKSPVAQISISAGENALQPMELLRQ